MTAAYPSRAIAWPAWPPALASLMPPVSGLLQPTEMRPLVEAADPVSMPGAKTSLLAALSGWQRGSTSALTTRDVMARPPRPA